MASTITALNVIQLGVPDEIAKALVKTADAAIVDINALQSAPIRASGASGQTVLTAITGLQIGTGLSTRLVGGHLQIWVA